MLVKIWRNHDHMNEMIISYMVLKQIYIINNTSSMGKNPVQQPELSYNKLAKEHSQNSNNKA